MEETKQLHPLLGTFKERMKIFHDAEDGYLLTFPDNDGHADRRIAEYRSRLRDLEHNIWNR